MSKSSTTRIFYSFEELLIHLILHDDFYQHSFEELLIHLILHDDFYQHNQSHFYDESYSYDLLGDDYYDS